MKQTYRAVAGLILALLLSVPALPAEAPKPEGGGGGKKININTADATQLVLLPRVGPSVAQRILAHRKENGPFKKIEDLMLVSGIGEKTFQLIKPYVSLAGDTTLKEKVKSSKSSGSKKEDR